MSDAQLHRWTASDGVDLAYREMGEGRPVVLVHGLFSNGYVNWIKFGAAADIASRGFRVIMPDLRAHGQSGKPHDAAHYPKGVLARDLRELVSLLGLNDFDLGGFSLGARTTVQAVGEGLRPRRAFLGGAGLEGLLGWIHRKDFFLDVLANYETSVRGDPWWFSIQFMKTMQIDRVAAGHLLAAFENAHPGWLAAFTMPTLVVCGTEDEDNGSATKLAVALPNATYAPVPGTHMSSVTKPEFGRAIARFLAD